MSQDMLGGSPDEVIGPLKDLLEKLGGDDGAMWLAAFRRFLHKQNPWPTVGETSAPMAALPLATPWAARTIRIGGKSAVELLADIDAAGLKIDNKCRELLSAGAIATEPHSRELHLVEITPHHLGFTRPVNREPLRELACLHGLVPCPAEVGPHLLLQGGDDWRMVMMEPLRQERGAPVVFRVGSEWLQASDVRPRRGYSGISSKHAVVFLLADGLQKK